LRNDYTTIGHVTADVFADGSRRVGGTAFYAAVQAARLGLRALIITAGVEAEIRELLGPFIGEIELQVHPAARTTALLTSGAGAAREQRVLSWAGPIGAPLDLDTEILHLAPVARETPTRWRGRCRFTGLTPQGLVRDWEGSPAGLVRSGPPAADQHALAERCDALVLSESERASAATMIERARRAGAVVAITAGSAPDGRLLLPEGEELRTRPELAQTVRDDLGAGDVFAAAFFVALHEGGDAQAAARFASGAAALRVEGKGAASIATRAEVEARLAR